MPLLRRRSKPLLAGAAFVVLGLVLTACVIYKSGSFALSQPGGIGSVRLHFAVCSAEFLEEECSTLFAERDGQALFAISVPKGAGVPPTATAVPVQGGPPVVLSRDDQVAQAIADATRGTSKPWPPAGTEGIGYITPPIRQEKDLREWTVDLDLGLPAAADGGPFGGPFPVSLWVGSRGVSPEEPASRPVDCNLPGETFAAGEAECRFATEGSLGTSDLKVVPLPPRGFAFLGGRAKVPFFLDFASTATALPSFNLGATSTLPKAKVKLASPIFTPAPPSPGTTRSPGLGRVVVTVPKNAKPGVYDVTLTATTPQGSSVSQVAKLKVAKAKIKLGAIKVNKAKGTATLSVKLPATGTLTVSGKGLVKKKAKAKNLRAKILVKPNAKTKSLLASEGQAKVKAKITFKPTGASAVVKSIGIVLKQG